MDKDKLECERLRLEIQALQRPFRHKPSLWISTGTAILAVFMGFQQFRLSKNEHLLAEAKSVQAQITRTAAETATADAQMKLDGIEELLAQRQQELETVTGFLQQANVQLIKAKDLLARLKPSAPEELQREISDFDRLREEYDPTGEFPYHVPP